MNRWRKYFGKMAPGHGIALLVLLAACIFTISVRGGDLARFVAAATSSLGNDSTLYFTPYGSSRLLVGDTAQVDVNVNAQIPINALGMVIKFSQDTIEIVGISKARSFLDLWTEETSIKEDSGEIHFSAGTLRKGGLLGTGTALTLTLRAKRAGEGNLYIKDAQVYAHDGKGTLVDSGSRSQYFAIAQKPSITATAPSPAPSSTISMEGPTPPSTDVNGDGYVNIFDASFLAVRMWGPYNPQYDLNMDGAIGFADISLIFARL